MELVHANQDTSFGRQHGFKDIHLIKSRRSSSDQILSASFSKVGVSIIVLINHNCTEFPYKVKKQITRTTIPYNPLMSKTHDSSYKFLFSNPELVRDLIMGFIEDDWLHGLDYSTLEKVPGSYISDDFQHANKPAAKLKIVKNLSERKKR